MPSTSSLVIQRAECLLRIEDLSLMMLVQPSPAQMFAVGWERILVQRQLVVLMRASQVEDLRCASSDSHGTAGACDACAHALVPCALDLLQSLSLPSVEERALEPVQRAAVRGRGRGRGRARAREEELVLQRPEQVTQWVERRTALARLVPMRAIQMFVLERQHPSAVREVLSMESAGAGDREESIRFGPLDRLPAAMAAASHPLSLRGLLRLEVGGRCRVRRSEVVAQEQPVARAHFATTVGWSQRSQA